MKLLCQADDFGFTRGVTYGIIDCIDYGVIRNTGLFVNMPAAELAVSFMKDRPHVCFGMDFNIVSGPCVADPEKIPHLIDEKGKFIRSSVRVKDERFFSEEGRRDMFPYNEVYTELKAQYEKFVAMTGKKPGYIHDHSLPTEHYREALSALSKETGVPYVNEILEKYHFRKWLDKMQGSWDKSFDPVAQLKKHPIDNVLNNSDYLLDSEYSMVGGHCGYVDKELLENSSVSLERCLDADMCMSDELKNWIKDNDIELITYYDLY